VAKSATKIPIAWTQWKNREGGKKIGIWERLIKKKEENMAKQTEGGGRESA